MSSDWLGLLSIAIATKRECETSVKNGSGFTIRKSIRMKSGAINVRINGDVSDTPVVDDDLIHDLFDSHVPFFKVLELVTELIAETLSDKSLTDVFAVRFGESYLNVSLFAEWVN